jgi:metallo-beta-lactamase class B
MTRGGEGDFAYGDDFPHELIKPDRLIADGERVELAGVSLTAHLTPGHTKGCTSWSMRVAENGKILRRDVLVWAHCFAFQADN